MFNRRLQRTASCALSVALVAALPTSAWALSQSPELDKAVKEHKLPAVEQRLPGKPQLVKPLERAGEYGGTLRTALRGTGDYNALLRIVGNQGLVRWNMDFSDVESNLAESWTRSPDATEYTFSLRPGTKWSDGSALTADDILFSMNDLVANRQFFPSPPSVFTLNDKLPEVTKVDDYTVRFKFSGPYLSFIEQLATPVAQYPTLWQKRYCSQFHPKYNPHFSDLLSKEKLADWPSLMRAKCGDTESPKRWTNIERPTLDPWILREPYTANAQKVVFDRNPYFWQVDPSGKQLPYIDHLEFQVFTDVEPILMAAVSGQLDFQLRHISTIQNRPVLSENQARGKYRIFGSTNMNANAVGIWINQSSKNARLRALLRNHDFREALSVALNRRDINDIVFLGQATPWQSGPLRQSKWYNDKLGTQYLNFDPRRAAELFDKLGLARRDKDGYRLYPDGGRVALTAIVQSSTTVMVDTLDVVRTQLAKVGIDLVIRPLERSAFYDAADRNDYDISIDILAGGLDAAINPRTFVAINPTESRMSLEWAKWYLSNGKRGEEPSASMKTRMDLYDKWQAARSKPEADKLFRDILQIAADEFEVIGIVRPALETGIIHNGLSNVYDKMPSGWSYPTPAPTLPQQWFFRK